MFTRKSDRLYPARTNHNFWASKYDGDRTAWRTETSIGKVWVSIIVKCWVGSYCLETGFPMCPAPLHTARNYFLEEPRTCVFKCTILAPRKHTTKPFSILQSWKTVIHRFLWSAELSIHVFRGQEIYKCLFGSWSISLSSGHYFPVLDNKIQDIGKNTANKRSNSKQGVYLARLLFQIHLS